jgi:hypothetical protein
LVEATKRLKAQGLKNGGRVKKKFVARGCGAIMPGRSKVTKVA